jgi:hypothetical protein
MNTLNLSTLAHEDVEEIAAEQGSPCCFRSTSEAWWRVEAPESLATIGGIKCQACAAGIESLIEHARAEGDPTAERITIHPVRSRAWALSIAQHEMAGIGTN